MALQIRRGPTADRTAKTFLEGELVYDTQEKALYVGDGDTQGGVAASTYTNVEAVNAVGNALEDGNGQGGNVTFTKVSDTRITASVTLDGTYNDVVQDTSPQLGGDLDLNEYDITGTGNINIDGTVTATSFSGPITGDVTGDVTGNVSGNAGTVTNGIYTSDTFYIGTEEISVTRSSNAQTLQGVSIDGNAATATTLETGRNINGVSFDGSSDVTVITEGTGVMIDGTEISIGQSVGTTDDVTFNSVIVNGDLTVNGTSTTLNTTTLDVEDKNITVAKGALNAAAANGAGLTVDGAGATLLYANTGDKFVFNKRVDATSFYGDVTGNLSGNVTGTIQTAAQANITSVGTLTGLTSSGIVNINYTGDADSSIVIGGSSTRGGAGFHDFLKVTNGAVGATNINKFFRLTSTGSLEIVDSSYGATIFSLTNTGTATVNSLVIDNVSTNNPRNDGIIFSNKVTGGRFRASDEIMVGAGEGDFSMIASIYGSLFAKPINIGNYSIGVKARLSTTRADFKMPVQFGRYSTTDRNALRVVGEVTGASGTGTVVTLTFIEQPQELFDVGASITVAGIVSQTGSYNGTFTVTASTTNSVSYASSESGTYTSGGTITGPVQNGTIVYDKDLQKFYGYANNSWFAFAAAV